MPIYEYRCSTCGHEQEFLRKMSDPALSVCPQCGKDTFVKKLTAAGFQLKGSGWYATDFKNGSAPKPTKDGETKDGQNKDAKQKDSPKDGDSGKAASDSPAPAPAPSPSPPPSAG